MVMYVQSTLKLSRDAKRRNQLKAAFTKYQNEDWPVLNNLFVEIEALERVLVDKANKKSDERTPSNVNELEIDKFNAQHPELVKLVHEKEALEENDLAAWQLFKESVETAVFIIEQGMGSGETDKNVIDKMNEDVMAELELLRRSVKFTTKVVMGEPFNEQELVEATNVATDIQAHMDQPSKHPDLPNIKAKRKWAAVALAFSAVLLVAVITTIVLAATSGTGAVPLGVAVALFYCGVIGSVGGLGSSLDRFFTSFDKEDKVLRPKKDLHRFHQSAVKHGRDLGVVVPPDKSYKK